jgi:microcystin-dependent protein
MNPLFSRGSLLLAALALLHVAVGQVGIGTTTPDAHSILTIVSTTKGVLPPRLTTAQQTTLASTLTTGEAGMLVADAGSGNILGWTGHAFVPVADLAAQAPLAVSTTNQVSINPGTAIGDLITWDGANWVNMQPASQHYSFPNVENRQPFLTLNFCIALQGIFPARSDANPFLSQIEVFAFNFAPTGWALCNGQLLPIAQNTALFSLLGTDFGGDGRTNFALPNFQGRVPVGMGQGPGLLNNYPIGVSGGVESSTISH